MKRIIKIVICAAVLLLAVFLATRKWNGTVTKEPETHTEDTDSYEDDNYETMKVTDARELLEAIGSGKRIILAEGEYNLSRVTERAANDCIGEASLEDGTEYSVLNVKDLIIEGEKGKKVTVVIEPRSANVLAFANCENITLKNLTVGHTITPGYCTGGVVRFDVCANVDMEDMHLYGCGTEGIIAYNCIDLRVKNTEIYECTYGLMDIMYSQEISFDNCIFRDTGKYDMFYIANSKNVKISDSVIKNNVCDENGTLVGVYDSENVRFENCDFNENAYHTFTTDGVVFENCRNNGHTIE